MRAEWLKEERPGQGKVQPARLDELEAVVGDGQVVSIASHERPTRRRRGRSQTTPTLCTLGDPADVLRNAERATTALRGMSASGSAGSRWQLGIACSAPQWRRSTQRSCARCRLEGSNIVLVVPAELLALPWAALPSLQDRPFTLAPTVTWWIDAALRPAAPTRSALVVAGPRLQEAAAEARGVAACHRRATVLAGAEATVDNVSAAMAEHDVAHVVAHGRFRHDNPLWSTIELDDGDLTVYELERLGQVPPTVVLGHMRIGCRWRARWRPTPRSGRHAPDHGRTHDRRRNRSAARHHRDSRHHGGASSGSGERQRARRARSPVNAPAPTASRV